MNKNRHFNWTDIHDWLNPSGNMVFGWRRFLHIRENLWSAIPHHFITSLKYWSRDGGNQVPQGAVFHRKYWWIQSQRRNERLETPWEIHVLYWTQPVLVVEKCWMTYHATPWEPTIVIRQSHFQMMDARIVHLSVSHHNSRPQYTILHMLTIGFYSGDEIEQQKSADMSPTINVSNFQRSYKSIPSPPSPSLPVQHRRLLGYLRYL